MSVTQPLKDSLNPEFGKPKLQVALDLIDLDKAIEIAKKTREGGADLLEAGTPLIKVEGLKAVRALKECFTDTTIVADMKTWDTGRMDVELAAKSGADRVIVLGAAGDRTIIGALKAGEEYGVEIIADMENCRNLSQRVKELFELGVRCIEVHVGWDSQGYQSPYNLLKDIRSSANLNKVEIAVAGGLTPESISRVLEFDVDVIVVGKYISSHYDPMVATQLCKFAMSKKRS